MYICDGNSKFIWYIIRINRRWSKIDILMIIDERTRTYVSICIFFLLFFRGRFFFIKSDRQRSLAFLEFVYYRIVQYRVMFVDHHQ